MWKVLLQCFEKGLGRKRLLNKTCIAREITLFGHPCSRCDDHLYIWPPLGDLPGQFETIKISTGLHVGKQQLKGAVFFEKSESLVGRIRLYDVISSF